MFLLKGKRVILSVVVLLRPLLTIVGQPDLSAKEIARRALPRSSEEILVNGVLDGSHARYLKGA